MGIIQATRRNLGPPPLVDYDSANTMQVGAGAFTRVATTTGGRAPLTHTLLAGPFPSGISVNSSTGNITGTPTGANGASYDSVQFDVTTRVTDADGQFDDFAHTFFVFQAAAPFSDGSQTSFSGTSGQRGLQMQGAFTGAGIRRVNNGNPTTIGQWYGPLSGVGSFSESDYDVRAVVLAGTLASGTEGVWLNLSSTQQWLSNNSGFQLLVQLSLAGQSTSIAEVVYEFS